MYENDVCQPGLNALNTSKNLFIPNIIIFFYTFNAPHRPCQRAIDVHSFYN